MTLICLVCVCLFPYYSLPWKRHLLIKRKKINLYRVRYNLVFAKSSKTVFVTASNQNSLKLFNRSAFTNYDTHRKVVTLSSEIESEFFDQS